MVGLTGHISYVYDTFSSYRVSFSSMTSLTMIFLVPDNLVPALFHFPLKIPLVVSVVQNMLVVPVAQNLFVVSVDYFDLVESLEYFDLVESMLRVVARLEGKMVLWSAQISEQVEVRTMPLNWIKEKIHGRLGSTLTLLGKMCRRH